MQAGMLLRSLAGVLVACLALQAATAAVHPDVMAFLRPQVSLPDDEGLQLGPAGRRLQQTFDSPDCKSAGRGSGCVAQRWRDGTCRKGMRVPTEEAQPCLLNNNK